jgi:hypothetical protein
VVYNQTAPIVSQPIYASVQDTSTGISFDKIFSETVATAGAVAGDAVNAGNMALSFVFENETHFWASQDYGFLGIGDRAARLIADPAADKPAITFNNLGMFPVNTGIGSSGSEKVSIYQSVGEVFTFGLDYFAGKPVYGAGYEGPKINREGAAQEIIYTFTGDSNTGIGRGAAGDMLSIFNGGNETVTFDTTNIQTVSAGSDIKAKITHGVDYTQQSPVIYGFNTTNATGLSCYSGDNTLSFHANAKAIFSLSGGTFPDLIGLDPSAVSADQPRIRSFGGDTSSRPIYSFVGMSTSGFTASGSGIAVVNGGTDIINCLSDGLYVSADSFDTSTSTSNFTADASLANVFRWKASFTTSQTLSISNLTSGRKVEVWIKNTHATTEESLTIEASSSTSGFTTVPMCVGNSLQNATSGLNVSAGAWTRIEVRNIGTDFVGFIV